MVPLGEGNERRHVRHPAHRSGVSRRAGETPEPGVYPRVVGMSEIVPSAICCSVFFVAALSCLLASGLNLPRPTPSWSSPKTELVPPLHIPSCTALAVRKTALSTPLSALVSTCGPRNDWSPSTPIPHTFCSLAASRAPRPQPPATWKTTFEPAAIWLRASSLHFAWS